MWRAVLFDVVGVLAHQDIATANARLHLLREGLDVRVFDTAMVRDDTYPLWELYSTGRLDSAAYWSALLASLSLSSTSDLVAELSGIMRDTWWAAVDAKAIRIVQRLRARGALRLGVLSNSCLEHEPFIGQFEGLFDALLFSHRTGLRKPRPEAYRAALRELAVGPRETVFIDDKARNLTPASDLGMKTLQFTGPADLEKRLRELELLDADSATR